MNAARPRLTHAVQPEVTESRVTRQWATIERHLPRRVVSRGLGFYAGFALLPLMAAAGIYWNLTHGAPVPTTGAVIEAARTPVTVTLRDGSTLGLDAQTKLRLLRDEAAAVDVELGGGKASFDVTHVEGRAFRVHAGLVTVRVLGTRFEVARTPRPEGMHIQVAVARGVVEVQRQDGTAGVRKLNPGETWSALIPANAVARPNPERPSDKASSLAQAGVVPAEEDRGAANRSGIVPGPQRDAAPELLPREPLPRELQPRSRVSGQPLSAAARARQARLEARMAARERDAGAAALLQQATLARRSGQMREAADAYLALLKQFPRDGRAGLAAFELGRIRMDALNQPQAAVEAFVVALRSTPRAAFREDALARIVIASDMMGDRAGCIGARERYQRDFPNGVHARGLKARCGSSGE